jgi:hypothetical protein
MARRALTTKCSRWASDLVENSGHHFLRVDFPRFGDLDYFPRDDLGYRVASVGQFEQSQDVFIDRGHAGNVFGLKRRASEKLVHFHLMYLDRLRLCAGYQIADRRLDILRRFWIA